MQGQGEDKGQISVTVGLEVRHCVGNSPWVEDNSCITDTMATLNGFRWTYHKSSRWFRWTWGKLSRWCMVDLGQVK